MNDALSIKQPIYSLKVISGNPYKTCLNDLILEKDHEEETTDHKLLISRYNLSLEKWSNYDSKYILLNAFDTDIKNKEGVPVITLGSRKRIESIIK